MASKIPVIVAAICIFGTMIFCVIGLTTTYWINYEYKINVVNFIQKNQDRINKLSTDYSKEIKKAISATIKKIEDQNDYSSNDQNVDFSSLIKNLPDINKLTKDGDQLNRYSSVAVVMGVKFGLFRTCAQVSIQGLDQTLETVIKQNAPYFKQKMTRCQDNSAISDTIDRVLALKESYAIQPQMQILMQVIEKIRGWFTDLNRIMICLAIATALIGIPLILSLIYVSMKVEHGLRLIVTAKVFCIIAAGFIALTQTLTKTSIHIKKDVAEILDILTDAIRGYLQFDFSIYEILLPYLEGSFGWTYYVQFGAIVLLLVAVALYCFQVCCGKPMGKQKNKQYDNMFLLGQDNTICEKA